MTALLDASIEEGDDEVLRLRKRIGAIGGYLVPPVLVGVGIVYLHYDERIAGWLYVAVGLWCLINTLVASYWHKNITLAFWLIAIPSLPAHLGAVLTLGNLVHDGGIPLWGLAFPVATGLVYVPARQLVPFYVLLTVNLAVSVFGPADRSNLPSSVEKAILFANLSVLSVLAVAVLALFVTQRNTAFKLLEAEQRKARGLLLSILPEEIADELTERPGVIAGQFDDVSVLFADVVGFTPMSEGMTPTELVEMLDDLFTHLDTLVDDAGLEKIKTIGDAYMVAAGVPRPRADHASALVTLALKMQDAVAQRDFRGRTLQLRIGVNSGSVVAGVIGRRKFSYDLWGDVVNTASRMESHGVAGLVQVTDATRVLIADDFVCSARGSIDVKGKGALDVWVVDGPRNEVTKSVDAQREVPHSR